MAPQFSRRRGGDSRNDCIPSGDRWVLRRVHADVAFVDVGPNLGAINRAALLASDDLVVPLAADLFSLQGLRNLGPTLREWRQQWQSLGLPRVPASIAAPAGAMRPLGYVVLQHAVRLDRPGKALTDGSAEFRRSSIVPCLVSLKPRFPAPATPTNSPASATTEASCPWRRTPASLCSIFAPLRVRSARPVALSRPAIASSRSWQIV